MNDHELTPLMRQYWQVKRGHPHAIVFFRVGDFYEMFYQDAEEASRLLSITLTSRDKDKANPVPLCGVPYHAASGYIAKLLKVGRTVALCDQVEDPKVAKGLVRREVVRLYTPGTLTDTDLLSPTQANYLAAVACTSKPPSATLKDGVLGLAALDVSTGDFWIMEFRNAQAFSELQDEVCRLDPQELLYPAEVAHEMEPWLQSVPHIRGCSQESDRFGLSHAHAGLKDLFGVASLEGFGCAGLTSGVQAAGAIRAYLKETQPAATLSHVHRVQVRYPGESMHLDSSTIKNLELVAPLSDAAPAGESRRPTTLLGILNRTGTAMGSRLLRQWVVHPLVNSDGIQARLDAVADMADHYEMRTAVRSAMKDIQDLLRLSTRISLGTANPRELLGLKDSLAVLPRMKANLAQVQSSLLQSMTKDWDNLSDLHEVIHHAILNEAPASIKEGGIIQSGFSRELEALKTACREGKIGMTTLEAQERDHTGIESLKVRYTHIFGYYIEVTKANVSRVPERYIRKQTLTNAERFTTAELTHLEERVTQADQQLNILEYELFEQLRAQIAKETVRIQRMGHILAQLDTLTALADTAVLNHYVKPEVANGGTLTIIDGRHPVIEHLQPHEGFIPNDTTLDLEDNRLLIITGPNMAGKSTYVRQVGLIVLMAQIGSFVPAREATIGLVDRIFTRVGASDNLAAGQSTFMVEMTETAKILHCATPRSLILLDEIGRGTSTYDGVSIAWAVAEFIQDRRHLGARTLFATHYHELTQLADQRQGIKNLSVAVKESKGEILFLRKIINGGADRSYGIYVAKLAGLPTEVIHRAQEVLTQLEHPTHLPTTTIAHAEQAPMEYPPSCPPAHPLLEEVRQMNVFSMTPLDALNALADLQRKVEEHSG